MRITGPNGKQTSHQSSRAAALRLARDQAIEARRRAAGRTALRRASHSPTCYYGAHVSSLLFGMCPTAVFVTWKVSIIGFGNLLILDSILRSLKHGLNFIVFRGCCNPLLLHASHSKMLIFIRLSTDYPKLLYNGLIYRVNNT